MRLARREGSTWALLSSTACSQISLHRGESRITRPDRPAATASIGSSESCFGPRAPPRSSARAESDIAQERSVRRPMREALNYPIHFVCGPANDCAN